MTYKKIKLSYVLFLLLKGGKYNINNIINIINNIKFSY